MKKASIAAAAAAVAAAAGVELLVEMEEEDREPSQRAQRRQAEVVAPKGWVEEAEEAVGQLGGPVALGL